MTQPVEAAATQKKSSWKDWRIWIGLILVIVIITFIASRPDSNGHIPDEIRKDFYEESLNMFNELNVAFENKRMPNEQVTSWVTDHVRNMEKNPSEYSEQEKYVLDIFKHVTINIGLFVTNGEPDIEKMIHTGQTMLAEALELEGEYSDETSDAVEDIASQPASQRTLPSKKLITVDGERVKKLLHSFETAIIPMQYVEPSDKSFFLHMIIPHGAGFSFEFQLEGNNLDEITGAMTQFNYAGQTGMSLSQNVIKALLVEESNQVTAEKWIWEQFSKSIQDIQTNTRPQAGEIELEDKIIAYYPPTEPEVDASQLNATILIYAKE